MARMCFPSCRFVKYNDGVSVSAGLFGMAYPATSKVGFRSGCRLGVLDRLTEEGGFGVRERDVDGEWKAYVKKRASDRWTSLLKLHLMRYSKASMKDGRTSSTIVSAFIASRRRLIIPGEH